MAIANLQAQITNLTSQLTQYIGRTTMKTVPTCGVSYGHGYPTHQRPQFTANGDAWGYQGYDQLSNNMFSNAYNSAWRDHSNYMWGEPQQFQQDEYWQQEEEFYSRPMQYAQSNSGSSINYNQILNELNCLVQGSQNQAKEAQQDAYWQPYDEFYTTPIQPPSHTTQQFQSNSSMSMDSDQILQVLTSLTKDQQNQDKKLDKLKSQMGEIMEFMVQIQEQSELSNATIENLKEDFEIHDAIIVESGMEVGTSPKTSKSSQEEDEQLLIEEEEEDIPTARVEQLLSQPPRVPMPSNSGKVVPNSIHSNPITPNVPFPRRFLIPKEEESEKDIVEALPKVQSDIPILGTPKQVPDCVEIPEENCTPRRIQEKVVAGEYQEFIKEDVFETTKPKDVEFFDTGQVPTITFNLAESNIPESFQEVVFVIKFLSNKASKLSSPISITFCTYMLFMIQAPTFELKPLADHFKYHLPFKDQFHAMGPRGA
ncbi:hypothetical protein ACFX1X_038358 [Malus domestica]